MAFRRTRAIYRTHAALPDELVDMLTEKKNNAPAAAKPDFDKMLESLEKYRKVYEGRLVAAEDAVSFLCGGF